ncbi:hypothetical protein CRYUN_Cryun23aG0112400 [Craigia yunnanensis]
MQPVEENYANPKTCFFYVLFKASALSFYILSALFADSFVIIFVITVVLSALDFWVVKNVSGRILVGPRWWNEISDQGKSIWRFECLDKESLARINQKDSWLFWWTLYPNAVAWTILGIFSLVRFHADYLLVVGVCLSLGVANINGFTKCRKGTRFCHFRFIVISTLSFVQCLNTNHYNCSYHQLSNRPKCEHEWAAQPCQSNKKSIDLRFRTTNFMLLLFFGIRKRKNKLYINLVGRLRPLINSYWLCLGLFVWIEVPFLNSDAKKIQAFASQTIASRVSSTIQSAFSVV